MLQHIQERRQEDKGFTLIELMVVVLIMGILMAIAIPTFLSTRGSANDASAKSNGTNAYTNEKAYYASNQAFLAATTTEAGNSLDNTLPWGDPTAGNSVVGTYSLTCNSALSTPCAALAVLASSADGSCFYIVDEETASVAVVGYSGYKPSSGNCAAPTNAMMPAAQSDIQSGGSGVGTAAPTATTWFAHW